MEEIELHEYITNRYVNCRGCWAEDTCVVKFTYEIRSGAYKMVAAKVVRIPDGWETRLYGEAGGTAHYCPNC